MGAAHLPEQSSTQPALLKQPSQVESAARLSAILLNLQILIQKMKTQQENLAAAAWQQPKRTTEILKKIWTRLIAHCPPH